jgi:hypothetical protein
MSNIAEMEPISAVATIVGVMTNITKVASAVKTFMGDVRDARTEMIAVRKELYSLKAVLEILEADLGDPNAVLLPSDVVAQILRVAKQCDGVVKEIKECLREQGRSGLTWAYSGKEEIAKLRGNLERHKIMLDVTLDLVSV